jgi:hypothetical protein
LSKGDWKWVIALCLITREGIVNVSVLELIVIACGMYGRGE